MVDNKSRLVTKPTIEQWEIINIMNTVWDKQFSREKTNTKAISEREWSPFNSKLITYPIILATITKEEKEKEESATSNIILPMHKKYDSTDLVTTPTFNPDILVKYTPEKHILNFGRGTAVWCLDSIIMSNDLMAARKRIRENQRNGQLLKKKMNECKKFTSCYLFKAGSCRIGQKN